MAIFGTGYQIAEMFYLTKMRLFSAAYVPFNFFLYYLSTPAFSLHFPFLGFPGDYHAPVSPPSDYYGPELVVGLLVCFPICLLAAFSAFAGAGEARGRRGALSAWLLCAWGVFATGALVLLFFHAGIIRYMLDFAPALMVCASVGLLVLERWLGRRNSAAVRIPGRIAWIGALGVSLFTSFILSIQVHATFRAANPEGYARVARFFSRLSFWDQRLPDGPVGPVEIAIRFDHPAAGRVEPLLALGWGEQSEHVFLRWTDAGHVVVGHRLGLVAEDRLSQPIPVRAGEVHLLYLDLGSLYSEPSDRAVGAGPAPAAGYDSADLLKRRWAILFDGDPVSKGNYGNGIGVPASDLTFLGFDPNSDLFGREIAARIVSVKRLTIDEAVAKGANRRSMGLEFLAPRDRTDGSATILAVNGLGADLRAEVEYIGRNRADLRLVADGQELTRSEAFSNSGEWHRITLSQVFDVPDSPLFVQFDGTTFATIRGGLLDLRRAELRPGWDGATAPQFTGFVRGVYSDGRVATQPVPAGDRFALAVKFPRNSKGGNEPLLVTGRSGRGDLYEVGYVDEDHIRFSLDHWDLPIFNSQPIKVDYGAIHHIVFKFSGMKPYAVRHGMIERGLLQVEMDGRLAWEGDFPRYPLQAGMIYFGQNDIGGTTCATEFTGELISREVNPASGP